MQIIKITHSTHTHSRTRRRYDFDFQSPFALCSVIVCARSHARTQARASQFYGRLRGWWVAGAVCAVGENSPSAVYDVVRRDAAVGGRARMFAAPRQTHQQNQSVASSCVYNRVMPGFDFPELCGEPSAGEARACVEHSDDDATAAPMSLGRHYLRDVPRSYRHA